MNDVAFSLPHISKCKFALSAPSHSVYHEKYSTAGLLITASHRSA
jgi:hypothetical protein